MSADIGGSNRLAVLAADIRAAHDAIRANAEAMAERALAAGAMLIEAKASLAHGEWGGWLTKHVGMSPRSARLYMQMSRSGLKTATVADLGIRGAAEAIAKHKELPAEDFRDRVNDSDGWPMPPDGGHVTILTGPNVDSLDDLVYRAANGLVGHAYVWPISEHDGVRYFDIFAVPVGPDRPATYLERGGAARVIAHALAHERFTLDNSRCEISDTPINPQIVAQVNAWRAADRAAGQMRLRARADKIRSVATSFQQTLETHGVSREEADKFVRLASIPEETFEAAIEAVKAAGVEMTADVILGYAGVAP